MPRMRVDLRPSTVQFDDGEDPVVGGLARFGTAMANLPVQIGRIKMEQAQTDERNNEFQAEHQLRMHADARAQEEHGLSMMMGHGKAIEEGYELPQPVDEQNMTADEQNKQLIRAHGEEKRQADLDAERYRASGHDHPYSHFTTKMGDDYILNEGTGEERMINPGGAPLPPAAKPPSTNWWTAPGPPSAFNRHVPQRPPAQGGVAPAATGMIAAKPSDTPGGVDPYDEAKRQYDQGNHMPLADLLRTDPKARERAAQDAAMQRAKTQKPNFAPPNTYEGGPPGMPSMSDMFGHVPNWVRSVGDYVGQHTTPGVR